ncbi:hypothetical protein SISNIDRAFT_488610 [Sistotremastrum niveocremeum HHB9708]|uniref:Cupredoxin n=1 Tax=Sistotremastrum niveocremeum HHB9708 TaxID=1314777 RepID=A0A164QY86_9AGAM|nr:hypothetical protein SISNIDRAFT_488610 [Sistotremastrum niveocremeum HHB9708]
MLSRLPLLLLLHLSFLLDVRYAVNIITVIVGDNGSFYTPNIAAGAIGDIINFRFTGQANSVTQSNYSQPCVPMPGGFHSGFAGINIGGTLDNPMEWNLTITDDSAPIWYHCSAIIPVPHCQGGMVGAINAGPSSALNAHNQSFDNFMVAAKAAPVLPAEATPLATAVLTGVGAMATATPMVRAGSVVSSSSASSPTSSSSAVSSSTSSATPSPTSQPASSPEPTTRKISIGTIIGGVVGGVVALAVIFFLLVLLVRSKRRARRLYAERMSADGSSWLSTDGFKITGPLGRPR